MRLAVIGTFYGRHENSLPILKRLFVESSRKPDEAWLMCETNEDAEALREAYRALYDAEMLDEWPDGLKILHLPTPKKRGVYTVIPYSNKINFALNNTEADAIVYLDNGSMPHFEKFRYMLNRLMQKPNKVKAVYCTQERTGFRDEISVADAVIEDAYCVLNYTQVMHRLTDDRWPTDMTYARPADLADATFWRKLHKSLGAFYPVGTQVLDEHHMPSPSAQGLG